MKKIFYIAFIALFAMTGCKKDNPASSPIIYSLPFETDNIKMEPVSSPTPFNTRGIYFFNTSKGLAINYDGKIYGTLDGGITWTLRYSTPSSAKALNQIYFIDANVGYAVGGYNVCGAAGCYPTPVGGLILKTLDGGNSWTNAFQMADVDFVSISSNKLGELFALARGEKGLILKSTNSGANWEVIERLDAYLYKLTFHDSFGFCTASDGRVFRSIDNGSTWILASKLSPYYITDIKFNSGIGFCISGNQTVFRTTDYGKNWTQAYTSQFTSLVLNPLTANNSLIFGGGRSLGGDFPTSYMGFRQTKDAGNSWTEIELTNLGTISYSSFYSVTEGYVLAYNQLIKVKLK